MDYISVNRQLKNGKSLKGAYKNYANVGELMVYCVLGALG